MRRSRWPDQVAELSAAGGRWDAIFCSDMLNLPEFLGFAPRAVRSRPSVAYFHENQLTYPDDRKDPRDIHFADRIDRWGYQETLDEYRAALGEADVFVSTARHASSSVSVQSKPPRPGRCLSCPSDWRIRKFSSLERFGGPRRCSIPVGLRDWPADSRTRRRKPLARRR